MLSLKQKNDPQYSLKSSSMTLRMCTLCTNWLLFQMFATSPWRKLIQSSWDNFSPSDHRFNESFEQPKNIACIFPINSTTFIRWHQARNRILDWWLYLMLKLRRITFGYVKNANCDVKYIQFANFSRTLGFLQSKLNSVREPSTRRDTDLNQDTWKQHKLWRNPSVPVSIVNLFSVSSECVSAVLSVVGRFSHWTNSS